MEARLLLLTGNRASGMPVRDVLVFVHHFEEVFEQYMEAYEGAVASGVAQVVEQIEL